MLACKCRVSCAHQARGAACLHFQEFNSRNQARQMKFENGPRSQRQRDIIFYLSYFQRLALVVCTGMKKVCQKYSGSFCVCNLVVFKYWGSFCDSLRCCITIWMLKCCLWLTEHRNSTFYFLAACLSNIKSGTFCWFPGCVGCSHSY